MDIPRIFNITESAHRIHVPVQDGIDQGRVAERGLAHPSGRCPDQWAIGIVVAKE